MNPLPLLVRRLGYAGLIPFIALALIVQFAPVPLNYIGAESLVAYGAVITSFLGAIHWGANLHTLGKAPPGDRWEDRNAWIWGIVPALVAWVALHIYIPVGLILLAATLLIQRNIDLNTYRYYFDSDEAYAAFMAMRNRLTAISVACLSWAAVVIVLTQD